MNLTFFLLLHSCRASSAGRKLKKIFLIYFLRKLNRVQNSNYRDLNTKVIVYISIFINFGSVKNVNKFHLFKFANHKKVLFVFKKGELKYTSKAVNKTNVCFKIGICELFDWQPSKRQTSCHQLFK